MHLCEIMNVLVTVNVELALVGQMVGWPALTNTLYVLLSRCSRRRVVKFPRFDVKRSNVNC